MKAIYLTGFMGAGKTSIGKELAKTLELPVIDTDEFIEEKVGKTIRSIFNESGETVFRTYEREYLQQLPTDNVIITTGGGIVIQEENRKWMKLHGLVIYLHCDFHIILERLKTDTKRPLLDFQQIHNTASLFERRLPLYKEAHYTINTSHKTIEDVVNEIIFLINNLQSGQTN